MSIMKTRRHRPAFIVKSIIGVCSQAFTRVCEHQGYEEEEMIMASVPLTATGRLRVYLIEDEEDLREALVYSLNQLGFDAAGFPSAAMFYRQYSVSRCDIAVVDVGLPDEDGFSIAEHLRSASEVGIVFASARGEPADRIRGMRAGADAYLVKPLDIEELAATLTSIGRRLRALAQPAAHAQPPATAARATGRWTLAEGNWLLCDPAGQAMRLTASERAVVTTLLKERGKAVDRQRLAIALGGDPGEFDFQRIDAVVSRLRRKATQCGMSLPLHAVRGMGYEFHA